MLRFIKRLVGWLALSLPVGIGAGVGVSMLWGENAEFDRLTSAVNGALSGASLATVGALMAVVTTLVARGSLQRAGGSELLTGVIVSYGLIGIGLSLLVRGG